MTTINYDRVAEWGAIYCAGQFSDHWTASFGDPVWERNGKDSGKIKIDCSGYHAYRNVRWISPGQGTWINLKINDVEYKRQGGGSTYHDCSGNDSHGVSTSVTAELIQTSSNPYDTLNYDVGYCWGVDSHYFSIHSDLGEYPAVRTLSDNFKVLPPKNLSGSVTNKSFNSVSASVSVGSWSDNTNITGTPYTQDGGRNWNFRAQIKDGGTVLAELTINTGETKNGTFDFTGLNLPVDKDLTMHFTCSNNYQQTIDYDVTFKIPFLGWVVKQGNTKKIKGIAVVDMIELGGATHWNSGYPKEI